MNYSELLQLAKGWGNFISDRIIIWRLPRTQYKLYPLSDCKETIVKYSLQIACPDGKMPRRFLP